MRCVFDITDLLQLQEIWVRRPILLAFSRLENRQITLPCALDFSLGWLQPRLAQLRRSTTWRVPPVEDITDPAQVTMCDLTGEYLRVLYPEAPSAAAARQQLFTAVYQHFVVERYEGHPAQTAALLNLLALSRAVNPEDCLRGDNLPLEGSTFWIPVDLTDEIRGLDSDYDSAEPGTPAAYVIADAFWDLLVKATPQEIQSAAQHYHQQNPQFSVGENARQLDMLAQISQVWSRSPSVVGLYYQTSGTGQPYA